MPSVHVDISRAINQFKIDSQELLKSVMRRALTRSCVRIRDYARKNHPKWDNRTGALEKAITYRFIRKWTEAEVYVNQDRLNEELDKRANWIDPDTKFTYQEVKYKVFKRNDVIGPYYYNYHVWLIEGAQARALPPGKTYRFIGKDRKLHFVRHPAKIKAIKGDDFLTRARNRININNIVKEVLSEYGIKSS